jgi:hypothetical protein
MPRTHTSPSATSRQGQAQQQEEQQQQQEMQNQNPPVAAARTPECYSQDAPLDYSQRNDIAIFHKGCKALEGEKYDGSKLALFLACLKLEQEHTTGIIKAC